MIPLSEELEGLNPYAPSTVESRQPIDPLDEPHNTVRQTSLLRTAIRWFVVCGISATPSFFWGLEVSQNQVLAMLTGVLIFMAWYTAVDYATAMSRWRQKKFISNTLRIVYGTRIAITIIFPVAMGLDMICGMVSVGATEALFGATAIQTFLGALFTPLIQGVVLNLVLSVYGLLILGLIMLCGPLINRHSLWLYGPPE